MGDQELDHFKPAIGHSMVQHSALPDVDFHTVRNQSLRRVDIALGARKVKGRHAISRILQLWIRTPGQ